jgi:hypothetical protein
MWPLWGKERYVYTVVGARSDLLAPFWGEGAICFEVAVLEAAFFEAA